MSGVTIATATTTTTAIVTAATTATTATASRALFPDSDAGVEEAWEVAGHAVDPMTLSGLAEMRFEELGSVSPSKASTVSQSITRNSASLNSSLSSTSSLSSAGSAAASPMRDGMGDKVEFVAPTSRSARRMEVNEGDEDAEVMAVRSFSPVALLCCHLSSEVFPHSVCLTIYCSTASHSITTQVPATPPKKKATSKGVKVYEELGYDLPRIQFEPLTGGEDDSDASADAHITARYLAVTCS
jgi:hypothetical protein